MLKLFRLLMITVILFNVSSVIYAESSVNKENNVFLSLSFDPTSLKDGTILQKDPLVMVIADTSNEKNVLVGEYVGKGTIRIRNEEMGYWKIVQVNKTTGEVVAYSLYLSTIPIAQLSPPEGTKGLDFGNRPPLDMVWAIGKPGSKEIIIKDYWDPYTESEPWSGFSDVPDISPFADHIKQLKDKKIIDGKGDGTFGPQEQLTRAAFTKMMVIAFEIPESENTVTFTDTKNHWAKQYIQSAVNASIVQGKSASTFEPETPLLREEAATIIWRYLVSQGVSATEQNVDLYVPMPREDGSTIFLPDNTSPWALEAVKNVIYYKLYGYGISEHENAYFFNSKGLIHREEAAALIDLSMRMLQKQH